MSRDLYSWVYDLDTDTHYFSLYLDSHGASYDLLPAGFRTSDGFLLGDKIKNLFEIEWFLGRPLNIRVYGHSKSAISRVRTNILKRWKTRKDLQAYFKTIALDKVRAGLLNDTNAGILLETWVPLADKTLIDNIIEDLKPDNILDILSCGDYYSIFSEEQKQIIFDRFLHSLKIGEIELLSYIERNILENKNLSVANKLEMLKLLDEDKVFIYLCSVEELKDLPINAPESRKYYWEKFYSELCTLNFYSIFYDLGTLNPKITIAPEFTDTVLREFLDAAFRNKTDFLSFNNTIVTRVKHLFTKEEKAQLIIENIFTMHNKGIDDLELSLDWFWEQFCANKIDASTVLYVSKSRSYEFLPKLETYVDKYMDICTDYELRNLLIYKILQEFRFLTKSQRNFIFSKMSRKFLFYLDSKLVSSFTQKERVQLVEQCGITFKNNNKRNNFIKKGIYRERN